MPKPVHVTFIHGLANKPEPKALRRIWLDALAATVDADAGFDLGAVGVTATFVYWADLFYDSPIPDSQYESRKDELAASVPGEPVLAASDWTKAMRQHFPDDDESAYEDPPLGDRTPGYERIPVPWFVKRRVMKHFLKEAHDYLFNVNGIRDTILNRVVQDFNAVDKATRHVLVGHSQGTFIAYDVLTCRDDCKEIDGLLTLGSPLGLDEVQDKLKWSREDGFPKKLRGNWVNVYDPYDPVSRADPKLASDFKKNGNEVVIDVMEENWGTWRHSATKYLKGRQLRNHLRRLCDREEA